MDDGPSDSARGRSFGLLRDLMSAAVPVALTVLVAISVNAATEREFPWLLRVVTDHPWWSVLAFAVASVVVDVAKRIRSHRQGHELSDEEIESIRRDLAVSVRRRARAAIAESQAGAPDLPVRLLRASPVLIEAPFRERDAIPIGGGHPPPDAPLDVADVLPGGRGSALILGPAGSGKTQWLRKIVLALTEDQDAPGARIPIILGLSTWRRRSSRDLAAWIRHELKLEWGVPASLASRWMQEGRLTFLFDQLDRVPIAERGDCLEALNRLNQSSVGLLLVVAGRAEEYRAARIPLRVEAVFEIAPLDSADVRNALPAADFPGLHALLASDTTWARWLTTPLLVGVAAREGATPETALGEPSDVTSEPAESVDPRSVLFEAVIRSSLDNTHCPDGDGPEDHPELLETLTQLAVLLDGQRYFSPDWLSVSWLHHRLDQFLVNSLLRVVVATAVLVVALLGILFAVSLGQALPFDVEPGVTFGLAVGFTFGTALGVAAFLRFGSSTLDPVAELLWSGRTLRRYLPIVMTGSILAGLSVTASDVLIHDNAANSWVGAALRGGLSVCAAAAALAVLAGLRVKPELVRVEAWQSMAVSVRSAWTAAVVFGLAVMLMGGFVFGPGAVLFLGVHVNPVELWLAVQATGPVRALALVLCSAVAVVALLGTAAWLAAGVDGGATGGIPAGTRALPVVVGVLLGLGGASAGGVSQAVLTGPLVSLVVGGTGSWLDPTASGAVGGLIGTLLAGVATGAAGAAVGWTTNGGAAWLQQRLLRSRLIRRGVLPRDYRRILDHAHRHRLLIRVNGGYGFEHDEIQDHIATRARGPA